MTAPNSRERILPRLIEDELQQSFINYSMSVIVSRALPDVRDGLKPVHRRILYAMNELGLIPTRAYKKSATVVGDVLGKYHTPHGLANAIMLPYVLRYSLPAITERLALLAVRAKVGSEDQAPEVLAEKFLEAVDQLNADLGIPTFLVALREADIPDLARAACREAHTGYPVPRYMSQEVCEGIIRQALPEAPAKRRPAARRKKAE